MKITGWILVAVFSTPLLAADTQPAAPAAQPALSVDGEAYEKVSAGEIKAIFEGAYDSVVYARGDVVKVRGVVTKFAVGKTEIALATDKIGVEGNFLVLTTKKYGVIKMTLDTAFEPTLWLTAGQKAELMKLVK